MASFLAKKKKASLQASGFTPLILGRPQTRGKTNLEGGKDIRLGFGRSRVKGHLRPTAAVNVLPRLLGGNSNSHVRKTERAAISGPN